MNDLTFLSLDVETTGLDPERHSIIQIGIFNESLGMSWRVLPDPDSEWDEDSESIHGITRVEANLGLHKDYVDTGLVEYVKAEELKIIIPVGFNVGSFDMLFVRKAFPKFSALCHPYRTVDINSLILAMVNEHDYDYDVVKREVIDYGNGFFEEHEIKEHDAFFDAERSWLIYRKLTSHMTNLKYDLSLQFD